MRPTKKKDPYKLRWPVTHEQHEYMRGNEVEQKAKSKKNPNELWMKAKLKKTPFKWSQQSRWGYRIFDFWCHYLGIAVEVDGSEHKQSYDSYRDNANYHRSGILVLRVRNNNEEDAAKVLEIINTSCNWNQRRLSLGLKEISSVRKMEEKTS